MSLVGVLDFNEGKESFQNPRGDRGQTEGAGGDAREASAIPNQYKGERY